MSKYRATLRRVCDKFWRRLFADLLYDVSATCLKSGRKPGFKPILRKIDITESGNNAANVSVGLVRNAVADAANLQFFLQIANLFTLLFVGCDLTFGLLLLVDQFHVKIAHLGTMMVDCHLPHYAACHHRLFIM